MKEEHKCEICNRIFSSSESLVQHNLAKHNIKQNKKSEKKYNTKKLKNWIIFILILGGIIWLIAWAAMGAINENKECKTALVNDMNIGGHTNLKLHIHSKLRINIDGKEEVIPANIGIAPGIMRPLHTHDLDNEIHIEGPCPREFKIGEFFQVWNREFSSQCIFDKCIDKGTLKMSVNGIDNKEFENYLMKDGDNIIIEYHSNI